MGFVRDEPWDIVTLYVVLLSATKFDWHSTKKKGEKRLLLDRLPLQSGGPFRGYVMTAGRIFYRDRWIGGLSIDVGTTIIRNTEVPT